MSITSPKPEWQVFIDLLRASNPTLLERIGRRMMNYLFKCNILEIKDLMQQLSLNSSRPEKNLVHSENEPLPRLSPELLEKFIDEVRLFFQELCADDDVCHDEFPPRP